MYVTKSKDPRTRSISYEDRFNICVGIRKRLDFLLKRNEVTYLDVSRKLGINSKFYSNLVNKKLLPIPNVITLYKLANYFKVSMGYLLMGDEDDDESINVEMINSFNSALPSKEDKYKLCERIRNKIDMLANTKEVSVYKACKDSGTFYGRYDNLVNEKTGKVCLIETMNLYKLAKYFGVPMEYFL